MSTLTTLWNHGLYRSIRQKHHTLLLISEIHVMFSGLILLSRYNFYFFQKNSFPIPKKGTPKECSKYRTIAFISHAGKVMFKILQAELQQYVNWEIPEVQDGLRKDRGTRDQIAKVHCIIEKTREFQKYIYFCFIDCTK